MRIMSEFTVAVTDTKETPRSPQSYFFSLRNDVPQTQQLSLHHSSSSFTPQRFRCNMIIFGTALLSLICLCGIHPASSLLLSSSTTTKRCKSWSSSSHSTVSLAAKSDALDDDIARQLERAKAVLAVSKAKMEARDERLALISSQEDTIDDKSGVTGTIGQTVPFFATTASGNGTASPKGSGKKERVIKSKNEDTGLFTTDGDLMAKLSESEEWQTRRLLEVFSNEREAPDNNSIANRDLAASISNLQRVLQTEDYLRIFDKRNRFIGDA
jgi:hypothetical protein